MKTTDIFKTTSTELNESMEKTFGKKLKLETFSVEQLEDARNKLRTQLHTARSSSTFNENVENDAYYEAQWMLDAINAELAERIEAESVEENEEMSDEEIVVEGEVEQASAIVTANTMVDRIGRWIEELSGMENDTLLQLGDSIRDEFGQEQSRAFIETSSPAIQQSLETLKSSREVIATAVRTLSGEEAPAEMLGDEPAPAEDEMAAAPEDEMNAEVPAEEVPAEDEFAAAEPAAGGEEAAGREQRESIDRSHNLLRTLAG